MSRNLFLKELKLNRSLFLIWALTIVALIVFTAAVMPAYMANARAMNEYLKVFPKEFLRAFSVETDFMDNPLSVFVIYDMLYTMLLGSIYAISLFAKTLHREQAQGTAEFLMAKPMSRWELFATKIAASAAQVLAMAVLIALAGFLSMIAFAPGDWSRGSFLVLSLYSFLLMLSFGAVGLLVSLFVKRAKSLTGPATGIVLGFYFYDAVTKMDDSYAWLGWLGPFKWVDTVVTAPGYGLEAGRALLFAALIAVCLVAGWIVYRRKDILS